MRLKEPLQGLKMAQAHIVIHWAFFVVMKFFLKKDSAEDIAKHIHHHHEGDSHYDPKDSLDLTLSWMKWGHFANGVLQLVCMILKKKEMRNTSETISILTTVGGYIFPLLRGVHYSIVFNLRFEESRELYSASWLMIELLYFFSYLISLMIFLTLAFWVKFKSIRKQKYDDLKSKEEVVSEVKLHDFGGIWNGKATDDFLNYLKWEGINFGYMFSSVIILIVIIITEEAEFTGMGYSLFTCVILFVLKRIVQSSVFAWQMSTNKPINWFSLENKWVITVQFVKLAIDIANIALYLSRKNSDQISDLKFLE
jgi:hypothetical protein